MRLTLFFIFIFLSFFKIVHAQQRISGYIYDETGKNLSGIRVYNITTGNEIISGEEGYFSIIASSGDQLRFISVHFERAFRIISQEDFGKNLTIKLTSVVREIEKVELGLKPTGDFLKDINRLPQNKKKERMEEHIKESIALGENKMITKPVAKIPESFDYTGIVKGGFPVGDIRDRRDKYHLMNWIRESLGEDYFTSMQIPQSRVDRFISYSLVGFDISKLLKYGIYTDQDLTNIKVQMEKKKDDFIKAIKKTNETK
ncbi:carboxypeptidase regulatory-like domain-containing protein [Elizabethkingia anophelis]|nr:carboxypeptidase regulatory-like domain-containing protein [Elizabethkingia anophelis]MCT3977445.1 carboxypeptidase regulatory-like domain-containing protein [Elizabethkingia anophelis]MCT4042594.1 carboxypeptidase regulatory-like domain-containing protein [Elizabethkingia anophelis]MCT4174409.1 carboxypeptidase regulatory-like domain-containing protein [Elizabethkingia anophelis]MCT4178090.1 carboxypeptidase regulatory-like domain-containing protein [Elizabethkingia anophelis]